MNLRALSLLACLAACGGDDPADAPVGPDARTGCDPSDGLPVQWRLIDQISTGAVTATPGAEATAAVIDASAGGLAGAADSPYVYLDLASGERVEVSDFGARDEMAWHLALKRSSILINGGDSGPGGVRVAAVDAAELAAVDVVPPDGAFETDDWSTDDCAFVGLAGGEPASAIGEWYAYDGATHALSPQPRVFVVADGTGAHYRLRIADYYGDEADPGRGAVYRIEWAPL